MATDNLMPQSSTSVIKHFMLRSSTTGQGLTGKVAADFSGKYNIAGGAEVTLSFSAGTAGDAFSSGKICQLGLGKYAWHVPNAVFASLGNVSAVLSVTGGIDVHCEWLVVAAVRDTAAFGANTIAPATPANVSDVQTAILAKLPAALESGRIAAVLDSATAAQITAIETFATRVTTGIVQDGAVWQFTANMLELGPSGGGGGGDASQATLLLVKAQTDLIGSAAGATSLLAASVLTPGTITEFPDTLTIGDSYTTANGRSIQIPIVDTDGNQISSTGSLNFADATATFVIKRAKETDSTRIITGTATFTDPVGTGTSGAPYAVVQLTSSETAKGLIGYKYSGVLTFTWPYVGTGTDPEVMSFETDTLLFDN